MKVQPNMSELFDQAIETFDSALKTGVRIQEEATRWWTDMLRESDSLQGLQHRAQSMMMEALPTTQKNMEQYIRLFDRTYHTNLELLDKAFQTTQSGSLDDAQQRIQEFWEATFAAIRNNAQTLVQVNTRTMEAWAEMARRDLSESWETARDAQEAAREAARETAQAASSTIHTATRPRTRSRSRSRSR